MALFRVHGATVVEASGIFVSSATNKLLSCHDSPSQPRFEWAGRFLRDTEQ